MLQIEMNATIRKVTGKGAMRQLRLQGQTPAVVYGYGKEGLALQMETQPLFQQLLKVYRKNAIIQLNLDDSSSRHVIIKDAQTDPIKDTLIHVDFQEIDINKPRVFEVPVNYVGNAKGCDLGGILNVIKDTIAVEAAPLDIPDELVIDVSSLLIGDSIKVEAVEIPGNLTLISSLDDVCVSVTTSKKGEDEGEAESEEEEVEEAAE